MAELIIKKKNKIDFGFDVPIFEKLEENNPEDRRYDRLYKKICNEIFPEYKENELTIGGIKELYRKFKKIESLPFENQKFFIDGIQQDLEEIKNKLGDRLYNKEITEEEFIKINNEIIPLEDDLSLEKKCILSMLKDLKQFSPPATDSEKKNNIEPCKKIIPLVEKINWIAGDALLRTHLEKLKEHKFIDYGNDSIDKVMSGDETAVFIKHKTYTAPCQNILALYDLWNEKEYISGYIDRDGKRQYKEFMENVFNHLFRGISTPISSGSMKSLYSERISKIINVKKHLESILI